MMTTSNEHNNAPAVPQGEPVYQLAKLGGPTETAWIDVTQEVYEDAGFYKDDFKRRILYATPAPAPAQGEPFGYFRAEPFGWTDCSEDADGAIALYERPAKPAVPQGEPVAWRYQDARGHYRYVGHKPHRQNFAAEYAILNPVPLYATPAPAPAQEVATLSLSAEDVHAAFTKNFPKTRISQAWISFAADIAQAIATRAAKPAQEVGLTEAERVRCLIASGCIGTVKMTYDSGPYEITRTSINASRLIDAIISALRAKGGK